MYNKIKTQRDVTVVFYYNCHYYVVYCAKYLYAMKNGMGFDSMVKTVARGSWVLGHTQQQGGSILQSGARAEYIPSRITLALSTLYGRMAARAMGTLDSSKSLINYVTLRPYAINEVIKRTLATIKQRATVVDPAAGYSPQFVWLAKDLPQHDFIEIDRETVILDKIHRIEDAGLAIPENLSLLAGDLKTQTLPDILYDVSADICMANGTYVETSDFGDLLQYLRIHVLKPKGSVLAAFPYEPGIRDLIQQHWMFRRFAGVPRGIIPNIDTAVNTMVDAGYQNIKVYRLTQLAKDLKHPIPNEVEIFVTGQAPI